MNKWMVRFWGFVTLASLLALIASTAWSQEADVRRYPRVTPNEQIAREALFGFTRTGDERLAQQVLDRAHQRLRHAAQADPDAPRTGNVLLRRGLNPVEAGALLTRHGLGFAAAEAKTPVSDGTVMTMWATQFGPFPAPRGSIEEQVGFNLGGQRLQFLRRAQAAGNSAEGRLAREIATSRELGVYRLEVWGKQGSLAALLDEPEVRGVVADENDRLALYYEQQRRMMDAMPVTRGPMMHMRIPNDPNEPLPPLPPDPLDSAPKDVAVAVGGEGPR